MSGAPEPTLLLQLTRSCTVVSRSFEEALVEAGGSLSSWLVMTSLKTQHFGSQREIAESMGVTSATLGHHLDAMVANGLLTRQRDPDNRRVSRIELTDAGEVLFVRLSAIASEYEEQLRSGITTAQVSTLQRLLCLVVEKVPTLGATF